MPTVGRQNGQWAFLRTVGQGDGEPASPGRPSPHCGREERPRMGAYSLSLAVKEHLSGLSPTLGFPSRAGWDRKYLC